MDISGSGKEISVNITSIEQKLEKERKVIGQHCIMVK
jgi:hypothetical protein